MTGVQTCALPIFSMSLSLPVYLNVSVFLYFHPSLPYLFTQAPRTRLPGSCPHPPGPLSAPTESALPGQVRCPDYWVCCCCSLNGEIGERTRKVRRHHRGAYSQSKRQQCPSQRALGAREKAGVPVPANPGSKPFSFPAAHWAPGSQQDRKSVV